LISIFSPSTFIGVKLYHAFPDDMLKELVRRSRSFRRFDQSRRISNEEMRTLVELARFCPSGANIQPLKFICINDERADEKIFPNLKWAGYLKDWDGPVEGEHPSAFIVIVLDREISSNPFVDHGIMAQTILLGATEMGLGGCMLLAFDKEEVRAGLEIPERYDPLLVVALGKPVEKVVIEDAHENEIEYYRDESKVHHVPKRPLDDLILKM
jgi:nitroreductase